MTNFQYVQQTIDLFEASLDSDTPYTTVVDLAERIGYSSHHLGRLFHSLCGQSLGQYMLKRRLSEAVRMIVDGENATTAARRLGWEDYSAFSRSFRKLFLISPGKLRNTTSDRISLTSRARPRLSHHQNEVDPQPVLLQVPGFHVTGLVFFMDVNEKSYHRPWRIFARHASRIRGRTGEDTYQFSAWSDLCEGPDEGMWIHCSVATEQGVPQDPIFFSRTIPASPTLRFIHDGPIEHLYDTYRRIWQEYLPRTTFKPGTNGEYQRYPDNRDPCRVEICLPVAGNGDCIEPTAGLGTAELTEDFCGS